MWVYLNDRIVQAEQARISVFDRGFLYGDGVFETVRIHDGRPVWLDRHLARLADSCKQIGLPLPDKPWPAIFQKVIDKNRVDHAAIRLTLSRGTMSPSPLSAFSEKEREGLPRTRSGGRGEGGETPTIVLFHRPLPHVTPSQRRKGHEAHPHDDSQAFAALTSDASQNPELSEQPAGQTGSCGTGNLRRVDGHDATGTWRNAP